MIADGLRVRHAVSAADRDACLAVRRTVFVDEQGVAPEAETDAHDATADHLLALAGARPVGAARWRAVGQGRAKIERVAVLKEARGRGAGVALVRAALARIAAAGIGEAVLHAQTPAAGFYGRLGFVAEGGPFDEEGIEHVRMRLAVARAG